MFDDINPQEQVPTASGIEDLSLAINLDNTGYASVQTNHLSGELDFVRIEPPSDVLGKYEVVLRNAEYEEVYVHERDVQRLKLVYPRIQPNFMNPLTTGVVSATFGVERKVLNEALVIEINGLKETTVTIHIRILK